jgi:hypothetical protein
MSRPVRIGNAHGFWGDRLDAAAEMLTAEPDLDFITLDFLAEVSMSLLAAQRARDPEGGWPRDIIDVICSLAEYWKSGGRCRLIANAGGLNPRACAQACQRALEKMGCPGLGIAVVAGDDVLEKLQAELLDSPLSRHLNTGASLSSVRERLVTANAYLGARPIADALAQGADIVITGRVADPSLTVAACAHFHGWEWDDWPRLAGATVAGHLIECGTQVTGGISTDWLSVPGVERIGFPIVEVFDSGEAIVTKPRGSGGRVTTQTVKEQLVYEIGDPGEYLSPDVTVSFRELDVSQESRDRVRVRGAVGREHPPTYKVSATHRDGFRAAGELTVFGIDAVAKARRAGQAVLDSLRARDITFRETLIECLGTGACDPKSRARGSGDSFTETVLRIAVADDNPESIERFSRALMPLITAGPPGTTGYAAGRPRVQPVFRYWPCLIERDQVIPRVELLPVLGTRRLKRSAPTVASPETGLHEFVELADDLPAPRGLLADIATARSGDKGIDVNIGVIARQAGDFERLCREVTRDRVAEHLGIADVQRVERFELPRLGALNLIIRGILDSALRVDAQGKALGQVLLLMPLRESAS